MDDWLVGWQWVSVSLLCALDRFFGFSFPCGISRDAFRWGRLATRYQHWRPQLTASSNRSFQTWVSQHVSTSCWTPKVCNKALNLFTWGSGCEASSYRPWSCASYVVLIPHKAIDAKATMWSNCSSAIQSFHHSVCRYRAVFSRCNG